MRVSYEWLSTMVEVPEDPNDLVAEFTRTGTEVEGVYTVGEAFEHVVTGQIVEKTAHPNSDHLWVTKVDVGGFNTNAEGDPEPLQIVCGAQNFNQGDHVVVALVGAELPGGITIKKSKLRGVVSCGMNCSERELGIGDDHSGIMILPEDAPVGVPFAQYRGTADTVLDCEITPNRPDCLSMVGIAREVGAIYDRDYHVEYPQIKHEQGRPTADELSVSFADDGLCERYVARIIRNVHIKPSPDWMVKRLEAAGIRPHNNIVDITNYVMMLTGQPLHSFDLNTFASRDGHRSVVVRAAHDGEVFQTLDGTHRTLGEGMALITDGERPVALAGVMGGMDSEISDTTTDVMIESAVFDAGRISHTSRDLSLISDASLRYERQVDAENCLVVDNLTCALIEELADGEVAPGYVDVYPAPKVQEPIKLRLSRVRAICGAPIEPEFISSRLTRLGCKVEPDGEDFMVTPPSYRPDLPKEIDLIEEVLRLWGMDRVESTIPAARNHVGGLKPQQRTLRQVGSILRACGLSETTSYSFASPDDLAKINMSEEGRGVPVVLMNPLVAEQTEMRRSLIPGLLQSVAYNEDHGSPNVLLYETGTLFFGREHASKPKEVLYVAGVLSGAKADPAWNQKFEELRFFDGKGVVEELLAQLRVAKVRFRPAEGETYAFLQPGRGAEVLSGGTVLGWVGEIHPAALDAMDISQSVTAFELNLDQVMRCMQPHEAYQDFSSYPSVDMDLAIVVDESVTCETLMQRIRSAGGKLLVDVRLFDVYRDPVRVGPGKKSMAFALTYRANDHTLTSAEAEKVHEKVVTKVCQATGGTIRS